MSLNGYGDKAPAKRGMLSRRLQVGGSAVKGETKKKDALPPPGGVFLAIRGLSEQVETGLCCLSMGLS